jgi:hypothetical protein
MTLPLLARSGRRRQLATQASLRSLRAALCLLAMVTLPAHAQDPGTLNPQPPPPLPIQIYATDFQPNVGVLASSPTYWNSLQETEKAAWKTATNEATKRAINEIDKREYPNRENKKISFVPTTRKLMIQFSGVISDNKQLLEDYKLLNEAKAFVSSQADSRKKKSN